MQGLYSRCVYFCLYLALATLTWAQAPALRGKVTDPSGSFVPGAEVRARLNGGREVRTQTNENGDFQLLNLTPGSYSVRVLSKGFAIFEVQNVNVSAPMKLDAQLVLATEAQILQVEEEINKVSTDAQNNVGALVLKGEDLQVLSDDPDQLANELQALAGPGAGPNGGQIFIDGFTGGRLPPKSAIREIRVNQNPYSAEFDRIGFGRIEILTKPGADKFRGDIGFNFGDGIFNSRNPFAANKAPFQSRNFNGRISGPVNKKASFSFDVERRDVDENAVINATTLSAALVPTPLQLSVVTPNKRTGINPRFDLALNDRNTLVTRYSLSDISNENQGIGQFSLQSRAFNSTDREHSLQMTETAILSARAINETRFQFQRNRIRQFGDNGLPAIDVQDSFNGGGAQIGTANNTTNGIELSNFTSLTLGAHAVKVGGRVRYNALTDINKNNFGGTFTFTGGAGPVLDANNAPTGATAFLTSLEKYRRTLLFQAQGLNGAQIRALGGGAGQFSLVGGVPEADISQTDIGIFITDDWRVRPNLTVGLGLRYENQTNVSSNNNIAPRISVAWGVDGGKNKAAKTVLRIGTGLFYDRVAQNLSLQQLRFNGSNQLQYLVPNPNFFPTIPSLSSLGGNLTTQTVRRLASDIRTPYLMQTSVGIDRQLPKNTAVAINYVFSRGVHNLRARNINAPLPNGTQPFGNIGNLYQFESTGFSRQNQLIANFNTRFSPKVFLFGVYILGYNRGDTDGTGSFPAFTYDVRNEYGRSGFDQRQRVILGGSITAKYAISLSPFIIASAGGPFNITTGRDNNGDSLFTDRPSFAAPGATGTNIRTTPWGTFNLNPQPGETIIPRNFGQAPGAFTINLRVGKTIGFGSKGEAASNPGGAMAGAMRGGGGMMMGGGPPGGGGGRGGGPGGPGGMFGGASSGKRYTLNISLQARNLLNWVNYGPPVGNLASPLFGQSTTLGGGFGGRPGGGGPGGGGPGGGGGGAGNNRQLELSLRFSF
ncbi:MAG: carboxypeptidase regulatory-like domain-containing protein [Bryobacteraceae bacterium]|nr:carboxypeptidase regulatory-like domain-containing protein [Bryobacteraceae bacterium]